jgi:hypothetical protein
VINFAENTQLQLQFNQRRKKIFDFSGRFSESSNDCLSEECNHFSSISSRWLNTYQGPIRIEIPIRINPQKLTYCKKACRARRFDFDKSGAYYGVLIRRIHMDVFNNPYELQYYGV